MKNIMRWTMVLMMAGLWQASALAQEASDQAAAKDEGALKVQGGPSVPFFESVQSAIDPELIKEPPVTIALLPANAWPKVISDFSKATDVDPVKALRVGLFGQLSVLPYHDLHIREVDRILAQEKAGDPTVLAQKNPPELGRILGVDALIYMDIEKAENVSSGIHSYTGYDATVRMVRARDGKELWRAKLGFANRGGVLSFKSSEVVSLLEFEQENQNRARAFRLAAQNWSRKVVEDLQEKIKKAKETGGDADAK